MISKETAELLAGLRQRGIRLRLVDGRVEARPAAGIDDALDDVLDDATRHALAAHEAEIAAFLRAARQRKQPTGTPGHGQIPAAGDGAGAWPLSFAQRRLWFLHRLGESSAAYNMLLCLRLRGALDVAALRRSFARVVQRHPSLRTTFAVGDDGEPVQHVRAAPVAAGAPSAEDLLPVLDLPDPDARLETVAAEQAGACFDLERGPLFAALLIRRSAREHVLSITLAHIIADGWSAAVLWRDLAAIYRAEIEGGTPELASLPITYADYAVWQQSQAGGGAAHAESLRYWADQLAELPLLDLPTDRPRPGAQTFGGGRRHFDLDRSLTAAVGSLAAAEGCTPFMAMLAAFQVILARHSGQEDIAVGTPVANRGRAETENLVGLFVNSVVLRLRLDGDPSFRECLRRVRGVAVGAFDHQDMPFEQLVAELRPERDLSRNPLFQVMFNFIQDGSQWVDLPGVAVEELAIENDTSKFDLTLALQESAGGLRGVLEFNSDLFDAVTVDRLAAHLEQLLRGCVAAPDRPVWEHAILTEAERRIALPEPVRTPYPERCLHTLVEERVAATPDAIAVVCGDQRLTYGELSARANQLGHHLRALGAAPGKLVGLSVERSVFMPIGMLGILKSGAAYVPMDPAYPPDRLAFMLEDAGADLFVTQESVLGDLPATVTRPVVLDRDAAALAALPADNPELRTDPDSLAHLIYSSGSTGRPKGARIRHRSLVNVFTAFCEAPGIAADDVLIAVTNIAFDLAGLDMFLPLVAGARMVIAEREVVADGRRLAALIAAEGGTFLDATPSMWRLLVDSGWRGEPRMRCVTGGEMMPRDLAEFLAQNCRDLWDCYAPCESTIYSTRYKFVPGGPLAVGRPLSNTQFYVLDAHGQPVPVGATGDIHIGGDGLALGYHNRPEMTAERFLPNPFAGTPEARMYRTGDLARWLPCGNLELRGRVDHQLKLRGYRIELGEIEHVLRGHEAIAECAVVARQRPGAAEGDRQLVGYIVAQPAVEPPPAAALRELLRETLPDFMVPDGFVVLPELPLTPNRKVDRKKLGSDQQALALGAAEHVAPRTAMEKTLAGIWREALGVERVGVHDNFFDLGGHSLLAMKVIHSIERATGQQVMPMDLLLETLEQLARSCAQRAGVAEPELAQAPAAAGPRVHPCFFGPPEAALYGVYHEPRGAGSSDVAVLLCAGFGYEYMAAHGTMQRLAGMLARAGLPALRFDYRGCGDSAGDLETVSVPAWLDDVDAARAELARRSGASRIAAVGLRLGGALVGLADARARQRGEPGFGAQVLWEPVVDGRSHLAELRTVQQDWLRTTFVRVPARHRQNVDQVVGFALPPALAHEVRGIDLAAARAAEAERVLVLQNVEGAQLERLRTAAGITHDLVPAAAPWLGEHGHTIALAPPQVLQRIVGWLSEEEDA